MQPFVQNLVSGDGQVAATPTAIATGAGNVARRMTLKFCNVGTQEETLVLTYSRNGGPQRRIKRVVLAANEEFRIAGLPINLSDVLYAQTTNANVMDYVVAFASVDMDVTETTYDDSGRERTAPYILEQMDAVLN